MATILIVDDSEMDRVLEHSILENAGHTLLFASEGAGALECIRHSEVDLVITDLAMPELNGLRLIKELREEGMEVPIIAVSGVAADQLDLAQDYGANFALVKPVGAETLLKTVAKALERKRDLWR